MNSCCKAVSEYVFEEENDNLRKHLFQLYIKLWKNSDAEKFYTEYHETIVMNAEIYFHNLEFPMCTLIATRLGDKILSYYKEPTEQATSCGKKYQVTGNWQSTVPGWVCCTFNCSKAASSITSW